MTRLNGTPEMTNTESRRYSVAFRDLARDGRIFDSGNVAVSKRSGRVQVVWKLNRFGESK